MVSNQRRISLMWTVALMLYVSCWFLPIYQDLLGYHGARLAHERFLELFVDFAFERPADLFVAVSFVIGWMANELFILGIITVWKWPRIAVPSLAFSLGVMASWQVMVAGAFPLLIGYWLWVAAGVITLWLSAERLARQKGSGVLSVLVEKMTLSLLAFPIVNAAASVALDVMK